MPTTLFHTARNNYNELLKRRTTIRNQFNQMTAELNAMQTQLHDMSTIDTEKRLEIIVAMDKARGRLIELNAQGDETSGLYEAGETLIRVAVNYFTNKMDGGDFDRYLCFLLDLIARGREDTVTRTIILTHLANNSDW